MEVFRGLDCSLEVFRGLDCVMEVLRGLDCVMEGFRGLDCILKVLGFEGSLKILKGMCSGEDLRLNVCFELWYGIVLVLKVF